MKTPDIPQECGLIMFDGVCATIASGRGVLLNLNEPQGRAALAAYCMAVIDELIEQALNARPKRKPYHQAEFEREKLFWGEYVRSLQDWRAKLARYGGFTQ